MSNISSYLDKFQQVLQIGFEMLPKEAIDNATLQLFKQFIVLK